MPKYASRSVIIYLYIILFLLISCIQISHSSSYGDIFDLAKSLVFGKEESKTVDSVKSTVEQNLPETVTNNILTVKDSIIEDAVSQYGLKSSIEEKLKNKNQRLIQKIKEFNKKRFNNHTNHKSITKHRRRKLLAVPSNPTVSPSTTNPIFFATTPITVTSTSATEVCTSTDGSAVSCTGGTCTHPVTTYVNVVSGPHPVAGDANFMSKAECKAYGDATTGFSFPYSDYSASSMPYGCIHDNGNPNSVTKLRWNNKVGTNCGGPWGDWRCFTKNVPLITITSGNTVDVTLTVGGNSLKAIGCNSDGSSSMTTSTYTHILPTNPTVSPSTANPILFATTPITVTSTSATEVCTSTDGTAVSCTGGACTTGTGITVTSGNTVAVTLVENGGIVTKGTGSPDLTGISSSDECYAAALALGKTYTLANWNTYPNGDHQVYRNEAPRGCQMIVEVGKPMTGTVVWNRCTATTCTSGITGCQGYPFSQAMGYAHCLIDTRGTTTMKAIGCNVGGSSSMTTSTYTHILPTNPTVSPSTANPIIFATTPITVTSTSATEVCTSTDGRDVSCTDGTCTTGTGITVTSGNTVDVNLALTWGYVQVTSGMPDMSITESECEAYLPFITATSMGSG